MSILSMPATSVLIEGGTTPNTPFGYCHELQLVANVDGTISPSSFIFGNKGDINVTSLDIDISALEALYGDILSKYSLVLSIYNPNEEYSAFNPYNYTLYTNHFPIPENITKKSTQTPYRCLLKLTEKVPSDGHIDEQEIWISKEFTATVNDTLWNDQIQQIIINATAPSLSILRAVRVVILNPRTYPFSNADLQARTASSTESLRHIFSISDSPPTLIIPRLPSKREYLKYSCI